MTPPPERSTKKTTAGSGGAPELTVKRFLDRARIRAAIFGQGLDRFSREGAIGCHFGRYPAPADHRPAIDDFGLDDDQAGAVRRFAGAGERKEVVGRGSLKFWV